MAPPEMLRGPPPPLPQQQQQPPLQPQQPLTETVASITVSGANQGANHHMIQHHTRPVSTMAPHHPHHPHHVHAAVQQHHAQHGLMAAAPMGGVMKLIFRIIFVIIIVYTLF